MKRIVIIGGGYSGVAFAAQLLALARSERPSPRLLVTLVEPQPALGRGLAYSTNDPDHRLNAPSFGHMAFAHRPAHFHEQFVAGGGLERDPQVQVDGLLYPRRAEFGAYLGGLLRPAQAAGMVRHCRDRAVALERAAGADAAALVQPLAPMTQPATAMTKPTAAPGARVPRWRVRTAGREVFEADRVVIATGHLPPATPAFVSEEARASAGYLDSPWNPAALAGIDRTARVLLLGSGLTAADVAATLLRQGHSGPIELVSRRGLRPQPLPPPSDPPPLPIIERVRRPVPQFLSAAAETPTVRSLLRALRSRMADQARDGIDWYDAFDDLRDAYWRLWPQLSAADQRRYQRHLKPWYDTYRYRMPPQTGEALAEAEARGQLRHRAARVLSLSPGSRGLTARIRARGAADSQTQDFDAVVNCTGLGQSLRGADALLDSLLDQGIVRPHDSGIGLAVDEHMAAVDANGQADPSLRIVGPPSAGALGDPIGAVFICAHLGRMMPEFLASLS